MFSLDQIYPGNVDNTTQTLGYAVGVDLSFGSHVKGGLGLYYTSLFGSFQEILLDANRFNAAFYGAISGPKGEAFIRVPTRIGTNSWFLFDFGFGVYFNAKNNIIEQFTDQVRPSINKEFYGMRWGLGADIKRVLIMLNGEIVAGISDDIDKTQFFQIGLTTGYAF